MQPYYEAKVNGRINFAGKNIPQVVTQIADGENGGVMMNDFPPKFFEVSKESTRSNNPLMTGSEYLEFLFNTGITEEDLPVLQPINQKIMG